MILSDSCEYVVVYVLFLIYSTAFLMLLHDIYKHTFSLLHKFSLRHYYITIHTRIVRYSGYFQIFTITNNVAKIVFCAWAFLMFTLKVPTWVSRSTTRLARINITMALDAGVKYFLSLPFFFQNQTVSKASVTKLQLRNWASLF